MNSIPNFASLSEAEQREVAERLIRIEESGWKPFWCGLSDCDGNPHEILANEEGDVLYVPAAETEGPDGEPLGEPEEFTWEEDGVTHTETLCAVLDPLWSHNHARADQRLPGWLKPWILFIMSGRGSGKTTTGVEFVTLSARKGLTGAIVGRRGTELENTHVATLIARAHPEFIPVYMSSKDILVWPNGAITYLFSAERPENIRSVNLSYAWVDEAAFMDEIETVWMNLKLATRIDSPGNPIHFLITSTPTSTQWVMDMEDDEGVEVRRVSTYANRANLSKSFLADMEAKYEGTRMGRQELHGEVLRDVEGALWNDEMFRHLRLDANGFAEFIEGLDDRVLAVDPAGSKGPRSDATGIIGVGAHHFDDDGSPLVASSFHVLCDATIKGTPTEWARQVFKAARAIKAMRIVVEKNFGGDMVKQTLTDFATLNPIEAKDVNGEDYQITVVQAVKSKETRAEPTVGKYEQGRVCVDGEALVPTDRGVIPLREVSRNDFVLTRAGLRRVTATWDQGVRDVVEVVTTEGTVVMTGDHEVFTSSRGWVHACNLVPTDTIVAWERYATSGPRAGSHETSSVSSAESSSAAANSTATSGSAHQPATAAGGIVSVRAAGQRHVYDISVEGDPEFFANGVLVHNCHVVSPHMFGDLSSLEKEQVGWVPKSRGGRQPSPNRIDALVWAMRALETKVRYQVQSAGRNTLALLKKRAG